MTPVRAGVALERRVHRDVADRVEDGRTRDGGVHLVRRRGRRDQDEPSDRARRPRRRPRCSPSRRDGSSTGASRSCWAGRSACAPVIRVERAERRARLLLAGAWAAAALGVILMTVAERSTVGLPIGTLLSSPTGHQLIARALGVVVCGLAVLWLALRPSRAAIVALAVVTAATLFVHAQAGHADTPVVGADPEPARPVGAPARRGRVDRRAAVAASRTARRPGGAGPCACAGFSVIAMYALVVVAVTGVLRAIPEVGSIHGLFHTSFGLTLLVKTRLVPDPRRPRRAEPLRPRAPHAGGGRGRGRDAAAPPLGVVGIGGRRRDPRGHGGAERASAVLVRLGRRPAASRAAARSWRAAATSRPRSA